ncbi:hypothetical protein [Sphingobacterium arenae]|uniref:Uncharacterized protein n=1 Tax=Sphingobacterium arenae TaxID=1280598 RepID=A0ABR7Y4A3_9SPHI|nr:hypothetical protein [Sphingobacterium arenae]MBD1426104.1 hypothetical protein [Sphingobacterium arenae]
MSFSFCTLLGRNTENRKETFHGDFAHVQARACTEHIDFAGEQNEYVACMDNFDGCQSRILHCLNGFVRVLSWHMEEYNVPCMDKFVLTSVRLILTVVKTVYYIACCVLMDVNAVNYIVDGALSMRKIGDF